MVSKEKTLKMLDHAYRIEEIVTLELKKELLVKLLSSTLPVAKKKEAKKHLQTLYDQSYKHAEMLGKWRLKILRSGKNDY